MSEPRFFNREVSWLQFNERVLEEAEGEYHPLLERVKFLSIFHSNLDEFFMIRVSGLQEMVESGVVQPSRDGLTPQQQLHIIRRRVDELRRRAWDCFAQRLKPALAGERIHVLDYVDTSEEERVHLTDIFMQKVYPLLTPLAVDPSHPFPFVSGLSINLAVIVKGSDGHERFARVKIPGNLPRLVSTRRRPESHRGRKGREVRLVWLEDIVAAHLDRLFPGMSIVNSYPFRVIRDADVVIRLDEASDLLGEVASVLRRRRFGKVSQLELNCSTPRAIEKRLVQSLQMSAEDAYRCEGVLGLSDLMQLAQIDRPDLKDSPFQPRMPDRIPQDGDVLRAMREQDILLHHPFESFAPVVTFVQNAAEDPDVQAIKQTIYRVGSDSPIVSALKEAALNGKQVAATVELKARFDEENNLVWARALEDAGAHVVYSDVNLKVHCKALLVVRREGEDYRYYVHLGTGNYNPHTALLYTDFGLFTCDRAIAEDVQMLFNALTGYGEGLEFRKLLVSPEGIRKGLAERVEREIEWARQGQPARLIFKMNSFTDFDCAEQLYEASEAGVQIDLIVRGSCCLVPGVPGMSENIRVRSIVGRFLEHDRVYYFLNGGDEEVWLGSADLMPRNLDRRYEVLFPITDEALKRWLVDVYLNVYLSDNCAARVLDQSGAYRRLTPDGAPPINAQEWLLTHPRSCPSTSVSPQLMQSGEQTETGAG
jgi:polyphosphate kinase